ncbi:caspase domain-containing protein [Trichoderma camerunense]
METENREQWAVLVGIDQYPPGVINLSGCVQDVVDVSERLRTDLNIPAENIEVFTAAQGRKLDYSSSDAPTKKNFLAALDKLTEKKAGGFVYIHYSGHGDRSLTKYEDRKGSGQHDECICTWEEDITDVELGDALDSLAEKHTVFVTLDSCHSGGADRDKEQEADPDVKFRCRSYIPLQVSNLSDSTTHGDARSDQVSDPSGLSTLGNGGYRNATPSNNSALYSPRKYNLLAGCQPNQNAAEWPYRKKVDNKWQNLRCGAMTYHFLKSLDSLRSSGEPVTYKQLSEEIQTLFRDTPYSTTQIPMLLGDTDRFLFATETMQIKARALTANVIATDKDLVTVTLNKGIANQITVGDKFLLYPPSQVYLGLILADDATGIEAEVSSANMFTSNLVLSGDNAKRLPDIVLGWFARLSKRSHAKLVYVRFPPGEDKPAYERIRTGWQHNVNPSAPYNLVFDPPANAPTSDFDVSVDEKAEFRVQDRDGNTLDGLPLIPVEGERNVNQLTCLLNHLCLYQILLDVKHSSDSRPKPKYDFTIERLASTSQDDNSLGDLRIVFKNNSNIGLYVTILNLGPAYGIQEVFPNDFASSSELPSREAIPKDVIVSITIPDILKPFKSQPGFQMRDTFKAFITTEPIDLSNYMLDDFEQDPAKLEGPSRATIKRPVFDGLVVEELHVVTQLKDDNTYSVVVE